MIYGNPKARTDRTRWWHYTRDSDGESKNNQWEIYLYTFRDKSGILEENGALKSWIYKDMWDTAMNTQFARLTVCHRWASVTTIDSVIIN